MTKLEKMFKLAHELKEDDYDAESELIEAIYYQLQKNKDYICFYAQSKKNGKYYCLYEMSGKTVGVHYFIDTDECGYAEYKNTKYDHYADELIGNIASNARHLYIM